MIHKYNYNILHHRELNSTNDYAKELLQHGRLPEGTVIVADYQTAGKGQDKNTWESEAGKNILVTMIFYPDFLDVSAQFNISISVALGIIDFLSEMLPGKELTIKWPNDIYVGREKIGGILINNEIMGKRFEHVIAGIGINVNQPKFSKEIPNPVSLSKITGKTYPLHEITVRLCDCVRIRYDQLRQASFEQLRNEYHENLLGMGEWREYIYLEKPVTAKIKGVNGFGKLMLETEDGQIECDLKELVYLF
jgi:BirA family biotin operon repressor/biotin-[acetyl-CoA-carboxylase] ligase